MKPYSAADVKATQALGEARITQDALVALVRKLPRFPELDKGFRPRKGMWIYPFKGVRGSNLVVQLFRNDEHSSGGRGYDVKLFAKGKPHLIGEVYQTEAYVERCPRGSRIVTHRHSRTEWRYCVTGEPSSKGPSYDNLLHENVQSLIDRLCRIYRD